jgi:nucleotide-binding universal stress UspA family protein
MFKHLFVPLDGSQLAEAALPAVVYLGERLGAAVTLFHVIERDAPKEIHSERHLTQAEEACQYLGEIAGRLFPEGFPVEYHVHTAEEKNVARSIVEHCAELETDLIVMCTHGHSGMRDWLFGNIAQQVIAMGNTPVLLVRPDPAASPFVGYQHILLPLDGKSDHEQGLPVAAGLARALGGAIHLAMVVPTFSTLKGEHAATSRLLPGATAAMLDLAELGGQTYLQNHLIALQTQGQKVAGEVVRGDPVTTIPQLALKNQIDLIVLGTHGRTGLDAFWSGSVAPQISSKTNVPLLLVPVKER